jgi:SRSO17 transposase
VPDTVAECRICPGQPWRHSCGTPQGGGRFARVEPRATAKDLVTGLLSGVERKNCWWLAEAAGHGTPDAMQRLLRTAKWDADAVRDDVRSYVVEHLGHPGGVLIADETGFLKKGIHSVGVQRQYTGTAGRVENSQVAVFLAYASPAGHALIDRRLYLPQASWCADTQRCAAAAVPEQVSFATKPALAGQAICDALDAGVPARWVTADEVYGGDPKLRTGLEHRGIGYVLAVACDHHVPSFGVKVRVDVLAARLPRRSWQRLSAGDGAKGPRLYDWAWIDIADTAGEHRWLLMRRNITTDELAFYRCWSPVPVSLRELVRVAATRWAVEECFQTSKDQIGLDHYQVRGWTPWHRFITLAMLALAVLAVMAAASRADPPAQPHTDTHIPLTIAEIRRLLNALVMTPARDLTRTLRWSLWRRKVQARARRSHYQRRLALNS